MDTNTNYSSFSNVLDSLLLESCIAAIYFLNYVSLVCPGLLQKIGEALAYGPKTNLCAPENIFILLLQQNIQLNIYLCTNTCLNEL